MTARLNRKKRLQTENTHRFRSIFLIISCLLLVLSLGIALLVVRPRKVECTTTLNTYCSESIQTTVQSLQKVPLWRVPSHSSQVKEQVLQNNHSVADVSFRRTWDAKVVAQVTQAEGVFPFRWENTDYTARENGAVTLANAPSIPVVILEDEGAITADNTFLTYDTTTLQNIGFLYTGLQKITPTIQKIHLKNLNEIVVYPEGFGPIYMRVGNQEELEKQLSTLQAFFHSTTMETDYQTLDIRFRDIIIK